MRTAPQGGEKPPPPVYGPVPGIAEYYGNSGWTPDQAYGQNPQALCRAQREADQRAQLLEAERRRALAPQWEADRRAQLEAQRRAQLEAEQRAQRDAEARAERRAQRQAARRGEGVASGTGRDRDGDGVVNRSDRFPSDPYRY